MLVLQPFLCRLQRSAHIIIEAKGEDEKKAMRKFKELIENKFGEE